MLCHYVIATTSTIDQMDDFLFFSSSLLPFNHSHLCLILSRKINDCSPTVFLLLFRFFCLASEYFFLVLLAFE